MTMTSEPRATISADRYAAEIVAMHEKLRFRNLAGALAEHGDVYVADHGQGLTTIVAATTALPYRYRLAMAGFRLAEYLKLGYASPRVVAHRAMFAEPVHDWNDDDIHCLTLDNATGQILGYITLVGPDRDGRFPVEHAHRIDVLATAGVEIARTRVREIKRFVQRQAAHVDRVLQMRISLELLHGVSYVVRTARPVIDILIGDVEPRGALRHLLAVGLRVYLIEGTNPMLSDRDLMHPMYETRTDVRPFVADCSPFGPACDERYVALANACRSAEPIQAAAQLIRALRTQVINMPAKGGER